MKTKILFLVMASLLLAMLALGCEQAAGPAGKDGANGANGAGGGGGGVRVTSTNTLAEALEEAKTNNNIKLIILTGNARLLEPLNLTTGMILQIGDGSASELDTVGFPITLNASSILDVDDNGTLTGKGTTITGSGMLTISGTTGGQVNVDSIADTVKVSVAGTASGSIETNASTDNIIGSFNATNGLLTGVIASNTIKDFTIVSGTVEIVAAIEELSATQTLTVANGATLSIISNTAKFKNKGKITNNGKITIVDREVISTDLTSEITGVGLIAISTTADSGLTATILSKGMSVSVKGTKSYLIIDSLEVLGQTTFGGVGTVTGVIAENGKSIASYIVDEKVTAFNGLKSTDIVHVAVGGTLTIPEDKDFDPTALTGMPTAQVVFAGTTGDTGYITVGKGFTVDSNTVANSGGTYTREATGDTWIFTTNTAIKLQAVLGSTVPIFPKILVSEDVTLTSTVTIEVGQTVTTKGTLRTASGGANTINGTLILGGDLTLGADLANDGTITGELVDGDIDILGAYAITGVGDIDIDGAITSVTGLTAKNVKANGIAINTGAIDVSGIIDSPTVEAGNDITAGSIDSTDDDETTVVTLQSDRTLKIGNVTYIGIGGTFDLTGATMTVKIIDGVVKEYNLNSNAILTAKMDVDLTNPELDIVITDNAEFKLGNYALTYGTGDLVGTASVSKVTVGVEKLTSGIIDGIVSGSGGDDGGLYTWGGTTTKWVLNVDDATKFMVAVGLNAPNIKATAAITPSAAITIGSGQIVEFAAGLMTGLGKLTNDGVIEGTTITASDGGIGGVGTINITGAIENKKAIEAKSITATSITSFTSDGIITVTGDITTSGDVKTEDATITAVNIMANGTVSTTGIGNIKATNIMAKTGILTSNTGDITATSTIDSPIVTVGVDDSIIKANNIENTGVAGVVTITSTGGKIDVDSIEAGSSVELKTATTATLKLDELMIGTGGTLVLQSTDSTLWMKINDEGTGIKSYVVNGSVVADDGVTSKGFVLNADETMLLTSNSSLEVGTSEGLTLNGTLTGTVDVTVRVANDAGTVKADTKNGRIMKFGNASAKYLWDSEWVLNTAGQIQTLEVLASSMTSQPKTIKAAAFKFGSETYRVNADTTLYATGAITSEDNVTLNNNGMIILTDGMVIGTTTGTINGAGIIEIPAGKIVTVGTKKITGDNSLVVSDAPVIVKINGANTTYTVRDTAKLTVGSASAVVLTTGTTINVEKDGTLATTIDKSLTVNRGAIVNVKYGGKINIAGEDMLLGDAGGKINMQGGSIEGSASKTIVKVQKEDGKTYTWEGDTSGQWIKT